MLMGVAAALMPLPRALKRKADACRGPADIHGLEVDAARPGSIVALVVVHPEGVWIRTAIAEDVHRLDRQVAILERAIDVPLEDAGIVRLPLVVGDHFVPVVVLKRLYRSNGIFFGNDE